MNGILRINYESDQPVSARDLYEALEIEERFSKWFDRMAGYGFELGKDYTPYQMVHPQNRQEVTDFNLTIDTAKEICMLQRTEKGKQCRQYFIDLEKAWNTPEQIMSRALKLADKTIESLKDRCRLLDGQIIESQKLISKMKPIVNYVDRILSSKSLVTTTQIAKDYGMSGQAFNKILAELKVQYKVNDQWVLYAKYQNLGYTGSVTIDITRTDGRPDVKMQTEWTQKGRLFLYELLKRHDIIPVIERPAQLSFDYAY